MADVQKYFEKFHDTIRIDYDTSESLRDSRDAILKKLKNWLDDAGRPGFLQLLQGSYRMGTGVIPIGDLEYDLDVGLRFGFWTSDHEAKDVRKWVFKAVEGHTNKVEARGPCIRVTYAKGYHLDLVCYATRKNVFGNEEFRLAKDEGWVEADPPALLEFVKNARKTYEGTEDSKTKTDQFRRCVRYLKRWNDLRIPGDPEGKPTGIAFVVLAAKHLSPRKFIDERPDDRRALAEMVAALVNGIWPLAINKPTAEHENLFAKTSDKQMGKLKMNLEELLAALKAADTEVDPVLACEKLREVFGNDFPVPEAKETACGSRGPAIVTSSASA